MVNFFLPEVFLIFWSDFPNYLPGLFPSFCFQLVYCQKWLYFSCFFTRYVLYKIKFQISGYLIYLALTLVAACKGWTCWSHSCGFVFMGMPLFCINYIPVISFYHWLKYLNFENCFAAFPKVLFFAAFLLLLSFWYVTLLIVKIFFFLISSVCHKTFTYCKYSQSHFSLENSLVLSFYLFVCSSLSVALSYFVLL